ncbi:MAG: alpha/beta fold hydrolase [Nanoarchaeota archaeon]|nr:alpha/beta fold hydrolase [Nanoarchaeota archaeon]MBU1644574.1 alpha/beta fold hydrolase [Nanoarchaeota archaeon]MBU1977034.1 alpha/beta fold hydrolase [Nanoarchaeota archaeon]
MSLAKAIISELAIVKDILWNQGLSVLSDQENIDYDLSLPTVILLHGYLVGAPSMRGLADYLKSKNHNVSCEDYAFWKSLERIELEVEQHLDQVCQKVGNKVNLVGHSEGGLVACILAKKFPEKVDKAISLGAPFQGTYLAYLNYFVSGAKDMVPESRYLQKLREIEFPEKVQFYSLYSPYDEAVIPASSSLLPSRKNIINICVKEVGHGGLIGKSCYNLIEEMLKS